MKRVGWAPNPEAALAFIHQYGSVVLTPRDGGWDVDARVEERSA